MSRRAVILILIGIILIAAGLRFYGLDKQSLWYDEMFEERAFQKFFLEADSLNELLFLPPVNPLLAYPITRLFPDNDFALRLLPFAFGLITIPLFFLLGRMLFNEKVGLISAFLLAISPLHIWYSQDIYVYIIFWTFVVLSLIFFVRALAQPTWGNYIGYLISTMTCLLTLQLAIILIFLQAIYILIFFSKYKSQFPRWLLILGIMILLYSPWIISTLVSFASWTEAGREWASTKEVDYKVLPYTLHVFSAGYNIGPSLRELHIDLSFATIRPYLAEVISSMLVFATLFFLGVWSLRNDHPRLFLLLLVLLVPICWVFITNKLMPNFTYNIRYIGIALFGFLLFVAKGLDLLSQMKSKIIGKMLFIAALCAVTGFSAYSYANYQFVKKYHKDDFRGAAAYIKKQKMGNDTYICIVNSDVFNRYSKDDPQCVFPPLYKIDKQEIDTVMREMTQGKNRIWLLLNREWAWPPIENLGDHVKDWLDTNYREIKELHKDIDDFANIRIYCYDLTENKSSE